MVSCLHVHACMSLKLIFLVFILTPFSFIASLIELLKEALDAEQSLFGQRIRPMDEWLKRYLKVKQIKYIPN